MVDHDRVEVQTRRDPGLHSPQKFSDLVNPSAPFLLIKISQLTLHA